MTARSTGGTAGPSSKETRKKTLNFGHVRNSSPATQSHSSRKISRISCAYLIFFSDMGDATLTQKVCIVT